MRVLLVCAAALLPCATAAAQAPAGFQGGPSHAGFVASSSAPPLGKRWVVTGLKNIETPVVYGDSVLVVSDYDYPGGGVLHAFDAATGAERWQAPGAAGRISAARGLVFSGSGDGALTARDVHTGAVRWTTVVATSSIDSPEPVAEDDLVFVGGSGEGAFETGSGLRIWPSPAGEVTPPLASGESDSLPASDGEKVYTTGCGGAIVARDRSTGQRIWDTDGDCSGGGQERAPAVAGGQVVGETKIVTSALGLTVSPWTGELPAIGGGRLITSATGALTARDASGVTRWSVPAPRSGSFASLPLIVGNTVYVRIGSGRVAGYDVATGTQTWSSTTRSDSDYQNTDQTLGLGAGDSLLVVPFYDKLIGYGPGADTPGVDPDPFRDPAAVRLRLRRQSAEPVLVGSRTGLRASYSRTVGYGVSGDIVVEADPFPFNRFAALKTVAPDRLPYLSVRPGRNTRYRLRYTGTSPAVVTKPVTVMATLPFKVRFAFPKLLHVQGTATLRGPRDVVRARRTVAWYYFDRSTGRGVLEGKSRLQPKTRGIGRSRFTFTVPASATARDTVVACLVEHKNDGFGEFNANVAACGRR